MDLKRKSARHLLLSCFLFVFFFRVLGNERWLWRNWPALLWQGLTHRCASSASGWLLVLWVRTWWLKPPSGRSVWSTNNFYMGLELENGGLCARAMPFVAKAISKENTIYLQKQWVVLYLPDGQKFGILKGKILGPVRWVGVESW